MTYAPFARCAMTKVLVRMRRDTIIALQLHKRTREARVKNVGYWGVCEI